ncbi:hypothetical protein HDU97_002508 [Phlyctochytrium planicorne]|nr:hypothetical protein HDU97_002508 [Phlyctochytrium planicorne]
MVGDVNLYFNDHDDPYSAEIEIMIAESSMRRKGIGINALQMMMRYGIEELGVTTFTAKISLSNAPSLQLFTNLLGFEQVSTSEIFQEATLRLIVDDAFRKLHTLFSTIILYLPIVNAWQTWCGLHYEVGSPAVIPPPPWDGIPAPPTVDWMVRPRLQPYTNEKVGSLLMTPPSSIVDLLPPVVGNSSGEWIRAVFRATVMPDRFGQTSEEVIAFKVLKLRKRRRRMTGPRSALDVEIPSAMPYQQRLEPFSVLATLEPLDDEAGFKILQTHFELHRLPTPGVEHAGSIVKMDLKTGGTIVAVDNGVDEMSEKILFPYGHYVGWGNYMENDFGIIDTIKKEGYTVVHLVPPFDDTLDQFEKFLDRAWEAGVYVQYDMRHTYKDAEAVTKQVIRFRRKPAIIGWYTADEPDGTSDNPEAALTAHNLIRKLDPYRPVALVLNCKNNGLARYSKGADIIMTDAYMIDVNLTFSPVWKTPCNASYGCCGCDGCSGKVTDIQDRLEHYRLSLDEVGMVKPLWAVLQGFGEEAFWPRYPSAEELRAMVYASLIGKATGILYWIRGNKSPPSILEPISALGLEVQHLAPYLLHPKSQCHRGFFKGADGSATDDRIRSASWSTFETEIALDESASDRFSLLVIASSSSTPIDTGNKGLLFPGLHRYSGKAQAVFSKSNATQLVEIVDGWAKVGVVPPFAGLAFLIRELSFQTQSD